MLADEFLQTRVKRAMEFCLHPRVNFQVALFAQPKNLFERLMHC